MKIKREVDVSSTKAEVKLFDIQIDFYLFIEMFKYTHCKIQQKKQQSSIAAFFLLDSLCCVCNVHCMFMQRLHFSIHSWELKQSTYVCREWKLVSVVRAKKAERIFILLTLQFNLKSIIELFSFEVFIFSIVYILYCFAAWMWCEFNSLLRDVYKCYGFIKCNLLLKFKVKKIFNYYKNNYLESKNIKKESFIY